MSTDPTRAFQGAERLLMNEYKTLSKEPWTHISLIHDNILEWHVALIVLNPDSLYYGGYFKAKLTFSKNYPYSPPDFKFLRPLFHPNVYPDGRLCISILHAPGEDEMSGELASERWSPAQRVESVLLSILSLLDDAETSSPANVDASVLLRKDPEEYKTRVQKDKQASLQDVPEGFVMPRHEDAFATKKRDVDEFLVSWDDSDVDEEELEFGGSDSSDVEMTQDEDDERDERESDSEGDEEGGK